MPDIKDIQKLLKNIRESQILDDKDKLVVLKKAMTKIVTISFLNTDY